MLRIHVLGIGGIGLSAAALLAAAQGHTVTGSDLRDSPIVARARAAGIPLRLEPWPEAAARADWLIAPAALPDDHPELRAATEAGVRRLTRDQALAELLGNTPVIAVVGTLTRSAAALALAELLGGERAGVGLAVGALPRREDASHVRPAAPGQPFVLELDERAPLPEVADLRGLLIADLLGPARGFEPRSFSQARGELSRAAEARGAWCVRPLIGEREDSPTLAWQHVDALGFCGAALRMHPRAERRVLELEPDRGPAALVRAPRGELAARALAAAVAAAVLGEGLDLAATAARLERDGELRDALEVRGQLERISDTPLVVHDVRTWPVAIAAVSTDRGALARTPYVLTRPWPGTLDASSDEELVRAFQDAAAVLILPPYPGGSGDGDQRLARLLGPLRESLPVLRVADEDEALTVAARLHTDLPLPWLVIGGDDLGALAQRLATTLEQP